MSKSTSFMSQYAIYERPKDFPDKFVVRKWEIDQTGKITPLSHQLADDLAGARLLIPDGFVCLPRYENDDPVIVEVWI